MTLRPHGPEPTRLLCPWDSPGKNTGVGCHAFLQGIFPTRGSDPRLVHLQHWQTGSLPPAPPGKPHPVLQWFSDHSPQAPGFPGNLALKLPAHPPGDSALPAATLQKEEKATAVTACRRWHAKQFHPAWGVAQRFPSKEEQTKDSAASRGGEWEGRETHCFLASSPPHLPGGSQEEARSLFSFLMSRWGFLAGHLGVKKMMLLHTYIAFHSFKRRFYPLTETEST